MDNKQLQALYEKVYGEGSSKFFSFSGSEKLFELTNLIPDWQNKKVLDVGCGEGDLAALISIKGGDCLAVDYSENAIKNAKAKYTLPNVEFRACGYHEVEGTFDVIVMAGILEHLDAPLEELKRAKSMLNPGGTLLLSTPSFLNPRGYIWMALQKLFDVPMSLSDISFLCPFDFEDFARELGATLEYKSVFQDWGHGAKMLIDYEKRLRNALRDKGMEGDVDGFMEWLTRTVDYTSYTDFSGAMVLYKMTF